VVRYLKQRTLLISANGSTSAFGTGPSSGYNPKLLCLIFNMSAIIFAIFITNLSSDEFAHIHIYATTLLIIFFGLNQIELAPKVKT